MQSLDTYWRLQEVLTPMCQRFPRRLRNRTFVSRMRVLAGLASTRNANTFTNNDKEAATKLLQLRQQQQAGRDRGKNRRTRRNISDTSGTNKDQN